jgi:glutamate dehydrogenase (NAD(P)+)
MNQQKVQIINGVLGDDFGPEYIIFVYDPVLKMRGFLVIDNTFLGPGKGGIRQCQR